MGWISPDRACYGANKSGPKHQGGAGGILGLLCSELDEQPSSSWLCVICSWQIIQNHKKMQKPRGHADADVQLVN